jgi:hypothetical protein
MRVMKTHPHDGAQLPYTSPIGRANFVDAIENRRRRQRRRAIHRDYLLLLLGAIVGALIVSAIAYGPAAFEAWASNIERAELAKAEANRAWSRR